MALSQRIESLQKRHAHIEGQINHEEVRPVPDTALLQQLKKEKLSLKDEISRLTAESQAAA
ncbi:MAG: YdcH family protein [Alphaproteobacteria bacterium]|nr:YdcH family protein [Alphaproteobacteria bacterium]